MLARDPMLTLARLGRQFHRTLLGVWLAGARYSCNLCHYPGRRFLDDPWHPNSICPACGSHIRHRLLWAIMTRDPELSLARLVRGRRVLHFAPERPLRRIFRRVAAAYVTADLYGTGVDANLDISEMTTVADASFDLVIACDVLEHVPHDRHAMREIRRVLAPDGSAILTVPQCRAHRLTFEPAGVEDPRKRERLFGQADHVRVYGWDFSMRLEEAGFQVQHRSAADLPHVFVKKHILTPPVPSEDPLASNERRVYFARPAPPSSQQASLWTRSASRLPHMP
jgi:hypothetical protein